MLVINPETTSAVVGSKKQIVQADTFRILELVVQLRDALAVTALTPVDISEYVPPPPVPVAIPPVSLLVSCDAMVAAVILPDPPLLVTKSPAPKEIICGKAPFVEVICGTMI